MTQELVRIQSGITLDIPAARLGQVMTITIPHYAERDAPFVQMWIRSKRSSHTRDAYARDIERLYVFTGKPLGEMTLPDLQDFAHSLAADGKDTSTQARILASIKSCFSFCYKAGYLPANVTSVVKLPKAKDELAQRILTETQVSNMFFVTRSHPRNYVLLILLYHAGLRADELCNLKWRDLVERGDAGQVTVFGKGNKTRQVLISTKTWKELQTFKGEACPDPGPDDYVFQSRKHTRKLSTTHVWRIVGAAAGAAALSAMCPLTGSGIPMQSMPWIVALRSLWSKKRWAMHPSKRRAATCTPGRIPAVRKSWMKYECVKYMRRKSEIMTKRSPIYSHDEALQRRSDQREPTLCGHVHWAESHKPQG